MQDTPGHTNLVLHKEGLPDCFSTTIGETNFDLINKCGNAFNGVLLLTCAF